ncbi:dihydroorotate dehydrogenase [Christensenella timonensis]|uniref:dihydroorotate dehydrogenase n=1 Tax=Christensenella timonensis TaxID=1816678 RepID=UPI000836EBE9|nr:dihydroorotate dehydrogenase [Christensenella timonensis]
MSDMRVNIAGVQLKNPVITASGTFGYAEEYNLHMDVSKLGAVTLKALTKAPRLGNPPVRIAETASGVLNAVGLQNPGVDEFLRSIYPRIKNYDTVKIANIAGASAEDYAYVAERLNDTNIALYEVNVSCPNVKQGGVSFGTDVCAINDIVGAVKRVAKKPLIVKLTPNVTKVADMAKAARDAGADAVSLINCITGMAIDAKTRRPILANVTGGLSGPAVKPVALRMVWEVFQAKLGIPIIGLGGIMSGEDAAEFMIAGASAVMVGAATMRNPSATAIILSELEQYANDMGIEKISGLTGTLSI